MKTAAPRAEVREGWGWSPDRRRRCGNVEIARRGLGARFPSAGGRLEKSGFSAAALFVVGRTFPRFPRCVISTATLPPSFRPRCSGGNGPMRRRFFYWLTLTLVEKPLPLR